MKTLALAALAATFAVSAVMPASAEEGRRQEGGQGMHQRNVNKVEMHRDRGRHLGWRVRHDRGRHEGWRRHDRDRHGSNTVIVHKHG